MDREEILLRALAEDRVERESALLGALRAELQELRDRPPMIDMKPVRDLLETFQPVQNQPIDMTPIANALTQAVAVLAASFQKQNEALIKAVVKAMERPKRTVKIEHDDGTQSTITEE